MFMRVVNLLTFKGVFSRVRRGKGKPKDLLSRNNPKAEWQIVNLVNLVNLHVNLAIVNNPQCSHGLLTC
jgi:hypothetical protein